MTTRAAHAHDSTDLSLNFGLGRRLPVVLQAENAECGLACLAMICGYHGLATDVSALRQRFPISSHGIDLKNLMSIADSLALTGRALKLDMDALTELQLPCILHWDMQHFVVLKGVSRGRYTVHDPAHGVRSYTAEEFSRHFTGIALELTPTQGFQQGEERRRLRLSSFWTHIVGLPGSLLQILFLALVLQILAVISPLYMQTVVDDVALRSDRDLLIALALGFALLVVAETGISSLRQFIIVSLSSRLNIQMAANLFRHLIRLPVEFFHKRHVGDVVSRFGSLEEVRELLTTGLVSSLVDGILVIITLGVMFVYNAQLTFIVLGAVLLYALLRFLLFGPLRTLTQESIAAGARMDTSFLESVRAIQTIKLFESETERQSQWQNRLAEKINKDIRIARLEVGFSAANTLLFGLENVVVIYFAATAVMDSVISLGMFYAFMSFKQRLVGAADGLIHNLIQVRMIGLHLDRLADIVFTRPEKAQAPDLGEASDGVCTGRIEVRDLAYSYGSGQKPVFGPISFTIDPAEAVAIVGPSGSGKTTLLKCMMGVLEPTEGEVLVDGKPISSVPRFRRNVASVMQDDQLLSGSIAENISFFDERADQEKVAAAAQQACIHEDILRMPMQYNTLVGDMGLGMSGGQRQRIMLARALYRGGTFLFMDEATSHMDPANEALINERIAGLAMTRILVAHREETVRSADRVIQIGSTEGL